MRQRHPDKSTFGALNVEEIALRFGGLRFPRFNGKRGLSIGLTIDFAVERGDHWIPVKPGEHCKHVERLSEPNGGRPVLNTFTCKLRIGQALAVGLF